MEKAAIYPGSFDPLTNGHVDVLQRALGIFDTVIVAVIKNPSKQTLFSAEERTAMIKEAFPDDSRLVVDSFSGLLVNYAGKKNIHTIIRGLRAVSDFEYEFQMALMNRRLNPDIKSVYLMTSPEFTYLSSSLIKEIYSMGGSAEGLLPPSVEKRIKEKFSGEQ